MNIWFISDTHFHHENIIQFCGRPFANADLMDEYMIQMWNETVKPVDHVYHLGDVMMPKNKSGILQKLHGKLRLVVGNHDDFTSKHYGRFEKMMLWRNWKEFGFTCSHIPLRQDQLKYGVNVHGHIHNNLVYLEEWEDFDGSKVVDTRYINVCVEHTAYKPVHLDSILDEIKNRNIGHRD